MTTFHFNIDNKSDHPLLVVPNDEGCLIVIGTNQAQMQMTQKQMFEKGMEFLRRSAAAGGKKEK